MLMPGIVMWPPTRYTARMPNVNSTRLRSSGIAKMFFRLSIAFLPACRGLLLGSRDHFRHATRRGNLLGRRSAELVRAHGQGLRDLATSENLHRCAAQLDQAALAEELRRHRRSGVEHLSKQIQIAPRVFDRKGVVKPALGHAAVRRHLPPLEPAFKPKPRSGLGPFVARG